MLGAPDSLFTPENFEFRTLHSEGYLNFSYLVETAFNDIVNSNAWGDYADAVVATMIASGYPIDRPLYIEVGNEMWNSAADFARVFFYNRGFSEGMIRNGMQYRRNSLSIGAGGLMALFFSAFKAALARAGRPNQKWVPIFAAQAATPLSTQFVLEGAEYMFNTIGENPQEFFGFASHSIAMYHSGVFSYAGPGEKNFFGSPSRAQWADDWRFALDNEEWPELRQRGANWILDKDGMATGQLGWMLSKAEEHKTIAGRFGVNGLIYYEGGSHDLVDASIRSIPGMEEFYNSYLASEEEGNVRFTIDSELIKQTPNTLLSNFASIGPVRPGVFEAPWSDGPWDANTPVNEAIKIHLKS